MKVDLFELCIGISMVLMAASLAWRISGGC